MHPIHFSVCPSTHWSFYWMPVVWTLGEQLLFLLPSTCFDTGWNHFSFSVMPSTLRMMETDRGDISETFEWIHKSTCHESMEIKIDKICSVVSDSLQPHELYSPWNSPGQNTGVSSPTLLQGIFPTHGSNTGLPHCTQILASWATSKAQNYEMNV